MLATLVARTSVFILRLALDLAFEDELFFCVATVFLLKKS
jgi:hypothetical protein